MKCFLFGENPDYFMNNQKCKSSTIKSGKWEEIEYSEIDTNKGCDEENDCKSHFCVEKIYEEISDGNRTSEALNRLSSFRWNPRRKYFSHQTSEKLKSHQRFFICLNPPFFYGFKETIFILETLMSEIIVCVTSYLSIFRSY